MGQGTESCGGYEVLYDEVENGLETGYWTTRDGDSIHISHMTYKHLKNLRGYLYRRLGASTFTSEQDKWSAWIDIVEARIDLKPQQIKKVSAPKKPIRGSKALMRCWCGTEYEAREADLKRGQGYSCCKSHAAIRRDYGRPAATRVNSNML